MTRAEEEKAARLAVAEEKIEYIDARTKRVEMWALMQLICWAIVLGPRILDLVSVAQVLAQPLFQ